MLAWFSGAARCQRLRSCSSTHLCRTRLTERCSKAAVSIFGEPVRNQLGQFVDVCARGIGIEINHAAAVELARLPLDIRGYEHIKLAAVERYEVELGRLREQLRGPVPDGR